MAHLHADVSALISISQIYSLLPTCSSPPLPTTVLGTLMDSSSCVHKGACYVLSLSHDPFSPCCHSKSMDSLRAHPDLTSFCLLCVVTLFKFLTSLPVLPRGPAWSPCSHPHPCLASPPCSSHSPSEEGLASPRLPLSPAPVALRTQSQKISWRPPGPV